MRGSIATSLPCLVVAAVVVTSLHENPPRHEAFSVQPEARISRSSADHPNARAHYEWMRLRSPETGRVPANIRKLELDYARTLPTKEEIVRLHKGDASRAGAVLEWQSRGPSNVGGPTRALAIDVSNENVILAGSATGGMWKSTDGGANWKKVTGVLDLHSVTSVTQDTRPGKTHIWYYTTGEREGNTATRNAAPYHGDGVFKSTDGGETWSQLPSTVSGTPHAFDSPFDYCWNVAVDPSNQAEDEVYVAAYGTIQRSTVGGTTWTEALGLGIFSASASEFTDVVVTSGGVVYATLSQSNATGSTAAIRGIWRSADGVNWDDITPPGWPALYRRIVIGVAPSNEDVVYFLAETPGSGLVIDSPEFGEEGHSLMKYTHSSGSWVDLSANLPAFGGPTGDFVSLDSYGLLVKVKPDDENVVFVGGINLYRSTNGFATPANTTWIGGFNTTNDYSDYPNHFLFQHGLAFYPSNPNAALSAHNNGVSKTTAVLANSVVWERLNNGYITSLFYTVALDHGTPGDNTLIGGVQDIGTYFTNNADASVPWVRLLEGTGGFCAIQDGRQVYYTSFPYGATFRELIDDDGNSTSWSRVDPQGASGYLFIAPFVIDPHNQNMMYLAAGDRIWRNSDLSAIPPFVAEPTSTNWRALTNAAVPNAVITALAISHTPANILYFGTHNGRVFRLRFANVVNIAATDIWAGKGLPANGYVSCIAIDPLDAARVLLVFSNYQIRSVFYTEDGGESWQDVSGNLEQFPTGFGNGPSVRWGTILPVDGQRLYFVATSTGIYSTSQLDGQATVWAQEGASTVGNVVVDMLAARMSDGFIAAATHGQGVFSAKASIVSVDESPGNVPAVYTSHQNYPNPFNPATSISYGIARAGRVELAIYNTLGQKVRTLVNEEQAAGNYSVSWDGRMDSGELAASGVYIYTLSAEGFTQSRKLTLLK